MAVQPGTTNLSLITSSAEVTETCRQGIVATGFVFAEPILRLFAWPLVLVGNLLGATVVKAYFWRHHPNLKISP